MSKLESLLSAIPAIPAIREENQSDSLRFGLRFTCDSGRAAIPDTAGQAPATSEPAPNRKANRTGFAIHKPLMQKGKEAGIAESRESQEGQAIALYPLPPRPSKAELERRLAIQGEAMFRGRAGDWVTYDMRIKACSGRTVVTGRYRSLDELWSDLIVTDEAAWEAFVAAHRGPPQEQPS
jgi:hypothetical protein